MTTGRKSIASSALELVLIVACALGLALVIQAFIVKPYRIPSGSMLPTLQINQRLLVDRVGMRFSSLRVGDIIVFHPPSNYSSCAAPREGQNGSGQDSPMACDAVGTRPSSVTFIKRVVGLPGDRISIVSGHVIRNGVQEKAPYIVPCASDPACNFRRPIMIPAGAYFVMGDNRPDSDDSRFWGPIRRSWIIGQAFFTYWPPDRIGFL
ncbi:MAG: signal peptidase I [Actinomycetota bacterium]|nr:signal peptidase I [Actinomycetota bacterium]